MANEKNETRVKVEKLSKPEEDLTTEEAAGVKGGGEVRRYDIIGAFPQKVDTSPTDIKAQE